jgi:hypothetical protein
MIFEVLIMSLLPSITLRLTGEGRFLARILVKPVVMRFLIFTLYLQI